MSNELLLKTSHIALFDNVHDWLKQSLALPDHYGGNLDALWDCLTGELSLPVTILWHDDAQIGDTYKSITDLFEEASGEVEKLEFGYLLEESET